MEYNYNQCPGFGNKKSSLNHLHKLNLAKSFPSCFSNQVTVSSHLPGLSSNISVKSITCGSRNIHVNKALYYHNHDVDLNPSTLEPNKTERVYYNPKFFKNNADGVLSQQPVSEVKENKHILKKQEPNIYVNPHFIKNDNSITNQKKSSLLINPPYRSGIHFNPKFFKDQVVSKSSETSISLPNQLPQECQNPITPDKHSSLSRYISKYKIIRKKINTSNASKSSLKKSNISPLKKYKSNREKLHPSAYSYLNKYALKRHINDRTPLNSCKKIKQRILTTPKPVVKLKELYSSEAKMVIINRKKSLLQQKIEARRRGKSIVMYGYRNYLSNSKYKYRRTPEALKKFIEVSPKSHYSKHHYHKSNSQNINNHVDKSVFKTISKTKIVRKSILQTQIESRRYAKKSLPLQRTSPKSEGHVSKYKIVNSSGASKRNLSSQRIVSGPKKNPMTFSSKNYRADKLKRLHNLTKKLRKNNQPCSFYNRYGRCKGKEKGSCPKVHDPKYVTICKKFLKGECNEEGCTLSHDIRPEKMPTCYHYLAGLCKRTNCPYLHIKVNRKAPICRAFLLGFCADVYTCNKRHEFICPVYVEKGYCLKGKSCSLPHRTPSIYSKLLEPDQFPLLNGKQQKKYHQPEVSKTDKHLKFKERVNENDSTSRKKKEIGLKKTDGKDSSKNFQRYFLASLTDDSVENENETISTT